MIFLFQIYFPNIFFTDIHMPCVDQSFLFWVEIMQTFCYQPVLKKYLKLSTEKSNWEVLCPNFGWALPQYLFFFSHVNKIWLNQTSVFAHRSNIGPPANILSRRICRIGSQDCIAWGLQTARIKLYHTQREIFVLIEFWMLFLLFFFFLEVPIVPEQRALCSEMHHWKCSQI